MVRGQSESSQSSQREIEEERVGSAHKSIESQGEFGLILQALWQNSVSQERELEGQMALEPRSGSAGSIICVSYSSSPSTSFFTCKMEILQVGRGTDLSTLQVCDVPEHSAKCTESELLAQGYSWDLNSGLLTEFSVVQLYLPSPTKSWSSHLRRILGQHLCDLALAR